MTDLQRATIKLLARCIADGLVTGLALPPETWAQCLEENFTSPPLAEAEWIPVSPDKAISILPPAHRCYCGCQ